MTEVAGKVPEPDRTIGYVPPTNRSWCRRGLQWLTSGLIWLLLLGMTGWGILAVNYSNLPKSPRSIAAVAFALIALAIFIFVRPRRRRLLAFGIVFVLLLVWWFNIPPSNNRNWQPDVAVLPYAEFNGNQVAIHNIRNCDYRSESDYDVHHYDRTFDLDQLQSVDLYLSYWGSSAICHTMMSFGFGAQGYVCISIETRKEQGEGYSAIKGFFRQFELTYVVADERDLVRLRTNFRHEKVYLYRLNAARDVMRKVFVDYFKEVNSLRARPEWYNALTSNCTSNIRGHTRPYARKSAWSWKLIVNGYIDELGYDNGALNQDVSFAELKQRSLINDRAEAAGNGPDFSNRIREGLPGM